MSLHCTYRETRDEPAEYESDNPVDCRDCLNEFDADDEDVVAFVEGCETVYLCRACADKAKLAEEE